MTAYGGKLRMRRVRKVEEGVGKRKSEKGRNGWSSQVDTRLKQGKGSEAGVEL